MAHGALAHTSSKIRSLHNSTQDTRRKQRGRIYQCCRVGTVVNMQDCDCKQRDEVRARYRSRARPTLWKRVRRAGQRLS